MTAWRNDYYELRKPVFGSAAAAAATVNSSRPPPQSGGGGGQGDRQIREPQKGSEERSLMERAAASEWPGQDSTGTRDQNTDGTRRTVIRYLWQPCAPVTVSPHRALRYGVGRVAWAGGDKPCAWDTVS